MSESKVRLAKLVLKLLVLLSVTVVTCMQFRDCVCVCPCVAWIMLDSHCIGCDGGCDKGYGQDGDRILLQVRCCM